MTAFYNSPYVFAVLDDTTEVLVNNAFVRTWDLTFARYSPESSLTAEQTYNISFTSTLGSPAFGDFTGYRYEGDIVSGGMWIFKQLAQGGGEVVHLNSSFVVDNTQVLTYSGATPFAMVVSSDGSLFLGLRNLNAGTQRLYTMPPTAPLVERDLARRDTVDVIAGANIALLGRDEQDSAYGITSAGEMLQGDVVYYGDVTVIDGVTYTTERTSTEITLRTLTGVVAYTYDSTLYGKFNAIVGRYAVAFTAYVGSYDLVVVDVVTGTVIYDTANDPVTAQEAAASGVWLFPGDKMLLQLNSANRLLDLSTGVLAAEIAGSPPDPNTGVGLSAGNFYANDEEVVSVNTVYTLTAPSSAGDLLARNSWSFYTPLDALFETPPFWQAFLRSREVL